MKAILLVGLLALVLVHQVASMDLESMHTLSPCRYHNGGCDKNARCSATTGGIVSCACKKGWTGDGINCTDVNECAESNGGCGPYFSCTNLPGSFKCVSPCANSNGGCDVNAKCSANQKTGALKCKCKKGFTGNGKSCKLVSDCSVDNGGCAAGWKCEEKNGKRTCKSPCKVNRGGCSVDGKCSVVNGTVACACKKGFSGNGKTCTDINECATNNGGCGAGFQCKNTPGSFKCTSPCKTNNGGCHKFGKCSVSSAGAVECKCKSGFSGDGKKCEDINECVKDNGGCKSGFVCVNKIGSRSCVSPCKTKNGGCDRFAKCSVSNTGTVDCKCRKGFSGDGKKCEDINECLAPGTCKAGFQCQNTVGSFSCVSPCKSSNGGCLKKAKCSVDAQGSIKCACPKGFSGDGKTKCDDVNECLKDNGGCPTGFTCVNTVGSFKCNSACDVKNGGCSPLAKCSLGSKGDVSCTCKTGFTGDGIKCTDVNECLVNNGNCPAGTFCRNTPGSRECKKNDPNAPKATKAPKTTKTTKAPSTGK